jgi:AcrR family transcriptional regulator
MRVGPVDVPWVLAIIATLDDWSVVLMAVVSDRMAPEIVQRFWAAPQSGEFITEAAERAGTYRKKGALWLVAAAGVSKPALSAHFRSKSELVAAVLERRHTRRTESLQAWVSARTDDPRQRMLAVFDWLADFYVEEGRRGCAFLNAAAETPDPGDPARQVALRQKRWTQDFLAQLARDARLDDPERVGSQLLLLIEGASSPMVVEGDSEMALEIAGQARRVAVVVLDAATSRITVPVA